jgi:hypothetical protein
MDLSEQEQYFRKYHYKLINEILDARAHLNLWERLEKYKSTSYIAEFNTAVYFFTFTQKAHLDDALLTLSRIFDRNKTSLTIWKFLSFAEENIAIFSSQAFIQRMKREPDYEKYWKNKINSHKQITIQEIDEDKDKLNKLNQILDNLTAWRRKVLAHLDRQFLLSGGIITNEHPLQIQQLHEIIETIFKILDRYLGAFDSSSDDEEISGEDDIQFVMDCLRFYIEEQHRQRKAKIEALKI